MHSKHQHWKPAFVFRTVLLPRGYNNILPLYLNYLWIIHLVRMQNFFKKLTLLIHFLTLTRMCAYQGVRNVSFSKNIGYVLNE